MESYNQFKKMKIEEIDIEEDTLVDDISFDWEKHVNEVRANLDYENRRYKCDYCEYTTKWPYMLRNHLQMEHQKIENRFDCSIEPEIQLECLTKCQRIPPKPAIFYVHTKNHVTEPYRCPCCNYKTRALYYMKEHLKIYHFESVWLENQSFLNEITSHNMLKFLETCNSDLSEIDRSVESEINVSEEIDKEVERILFSDTTATECIKMIKSYLTSNVKTTNQCKAVNNANLNKLESMRTENLERNKQNEHESVEYLKMNKVHGTEKLTAGHEKQKLLESRNQITSSKVVRNNVPLPEQKTDSESFSFDGVRQRVTEQSTSGSKCSRGRSKSVVKLPILKSTNESLEFFSKNVSSREENDEQVAAIQKATSKPEVNEKPGLLEKPQCFKSDDHPGWRPRLSRPKSAAPYLVLNSNNEPSGRKSFANGTQKQKVGKTNLESVVERDLNFLPRPKSVISCSEPRRRRGRPRGARKRSKSVSLCLILESGNQPLKFFSAEKPSDNISTRLLQANQKWNIESKSKIDEQLDFPKRLTSDTHSLKSKCLPDSSRGSNRQLKDLALCPMGNQSNNEHLELPTGTRITRSKTRLEAYKRQTTGSITTGETSNKRPKENEAAKSLKMVQKCMKNVRPKSRSSNKMNSDLWAMDLNNKIQSNEIISVRSVDALETTKLTTPGSEAKRSTGCYISATKRSKTEALQQSGHNTINTDTEKPLNIIITRSKSRLINSKKDKIEKSENVDVSVNSTVKRKFSDEMVSSNKKTSKSDRKPPTMSSKVDDVRNKSTVTHESSLLISDAANNKAGIIKRDYTAGETSVTSQIVPSKNKSSLVKLQDDFPKQIPQNTSCTLSGTTAAVLSVSAVEPKTIAQFVHDKVKRNTRSCRFCQHKSYEKHINRPVKPETTVSQTTNQVTNQSEVAPLITSPERAYVLTENGTQFATVSSTLDHLSVFHHAQNNDGRDIMATSGMGFKSFGHVNPNNECPLVREYTDIDIALSRLNSDLAEIAMTEVASAGQSSSDNNATDITDPRPDEMELQYDI